MAMSIKPTNELRFCPYCNTELTTNNFYQSKNPHHNGFLPYCKNHCNEINKEYRDKTQDPVKALWYTCAELGVPFVLEVYKRFDKNKKDIIEKRQNKIDPKTGKKKYNPKQMVDYINNYKDFALYYDFLKNKFSEGANDWSTFYSGTDVDWRDVSNNIKDLEIKESEKEQYILDWGLQDDIDDYRFLDNVFAKYTKGVEFINPQQEDLYRDLCRDRLLLRKINDERYKGSETIDNIQKRIDRTMTTLKVNNFEDTRPKTASEQCFFAKIAQIETTKPADLYKEPKKYKDFNKLQRYEKDMVLRPLANMLCGMRDFNIDIDDINKYNMDEDVDEGGDN